MRNIGKTTRFGVFRWIYQAIKTKEFSSCKKNYNNNYLKNFP